MQGTEANTAHNTAAIDLITATGAPNTDQSTDGNRQVAAVPRAPAESSVAVKQEVATDAAPVNKRQKTVSAEAQAAMAIISATARLPSQVAESFL